MTSESQLLARIQAKLPHIRGGQVVTGIGDDCAVVRPRGSTEDWCFTTDFLIEHVHFLPARSKPQDLGHKALARSLSDLAAMGAQPRFCLVSLALAPWTTTPWVERFYDGLLALAAQHSVVLAGGDLAKTDRVVCDVMACGSVPRGQALLRSKARPGERIYVTGTLGGSALGLATGKGKSWTRHMRPEPRVTAGRELRALGVRCAMDLSDGLSTDLERLCLASGVGAELQDVPLFPGATLDQALHGGEDYELLFTSKHEFPSTIAGVPLTPIGRITRKKGLQWRGAPLQALGWDHLKSS